MELCSLFLAVRVVRGQMSACRLLYYARYLHLDLSKHVMRNVSRLRLRAHSLKVEAAAWLEDGSRVCDQCPGEDGHVQNEVHVLLFCQDHRVCELRKHFSFLFTLFLRNFHPFCCNRSTTNLFMISFLSRTLDFFFSFWAYGFICGWPRPVSSRSAKQPGWRSPPIIISVTIVRAVQGHSLDSAHQPNIVWLPTTPFVNSVNPLHKSQPKG